MMIKSMTGYGRGVEVSDFGTVTVELRSFNHRYFEINIRLPKEFNGTEDEVKRTIQERIKRGKVDCLITVEYNKGDHPAFVINWELVDHYFSAAASISDRLSIPNTIRIESILALPDVLQPSQIDRLEADHPAIKQAVEKAVLALWEMRVNEGNNICGDFIKRVNYILQQLDIIRQQAPQITKQYNTRLIARVREFLEGSAELDESRIMNEVALFADRSNIDEELLRLESHSKQFLDLLEVDEPVGRKLDFILQEMNREINTIGAKANDLLISQTVIHVKSEIEKLREQVQNIE